MEHLEPEPYAGEPADDVAAEGGAAESVPEGAPETAEPVGRRYPSTIGGACYLVVLATSTFGLAVTARGNWRLGVRWIALSLIAAAVIRLFLPARDAGMLAVRRRAVDVALLAIVGVALLVLATVIPDQPPL